MADEDRVLLLRDKRKSLIPMTKAPILSENESQETTQKTTKTSITQRLRTEEGRSVVVFTAIKLV